MRYCDQCNIYRPPTRCSHCYVCGVCIIGYDHHCQWLGMCIGARNYLHFIAFLTIALTFIVFNEYCLLLEISEVSQLASFGEAIGDGPHTILAVPLIFLFLFLVGLLLAFHLFLIFKNQTTHEFLKGLYDMDESAQRRATAAKKMMPTVNPYIVNSDLKFRLAGILKRMKKSLTYPSMLKPG